MAAARNGALAKWALGIAGGLVTAAVIGLVAMSVSHGKEIASLEQTVRPVETHEPRIVRVETKVEALDKAIDELKAGQKKILDKLDEMRAR